MRLILFIFFLFSIGVQAQEKNSNGYGVEAKRIDTLISKSLKKIDGYDTSYVLEDSCKVLNGKLEYVTVFFKTLVPVKVWDELISKYDNKEKEFFSSIGVGLTIKAKYTLSNNLSFEPFRHQFVLYDKNSNTFNCDYKMMGRNGYGNMVETTALVKYDPAELNKKNIP